MRKPITICAGLVLAATAWASPADWTLFVPATATAVRADNTPGELKVFVAPGSSLYLVERTPIIVIDLDARTVTAVPRSRAEATERGWLVDLEAATAEPESGVTTVALRGDLRAVHAWWKGKDVRFKVPPPPPSPPARPEPPTSPSPTHQVPPSPVTQGAGGGVRPNPPTDDDAFRSLAHGLSWRPPRVMGEVPPPSVEKVPVPDFSFPGLRPLGIAYRIRGGAPLRAPVELMIPVPPSAFQTDRDIVVVRLSDDGLSVVRPLVIDREGRTATVATTSFSTWVPCISDGYGYPHADVHGTLRLREDCEETPSWVFFDVTPTETASGESANFVVGTDGIGPYRVVPAIPADLFGTYTFHKVVGQSASFFYGSPPPKPSQVIDQVGGSYVQDIEVVPTTGRLRGTVKNRQGKAMTGVRVEILSDDLVYATTTLGDGGYEIELIGLGPAQRDPVRQVPYRLVKGEEKCEQDSGWIAMRTGVTTSYDFTFEPQGELRGQVLDQSDEPVSGAAVEVIDTDGRKHATTTASDGMYLVGKMQTGPASVTATCPKREDSRNRDHTIRCDDETDRLDFQLSCGDPVAATVTFRIRRGDAAIVEALAEGHLPINIGRDGAISGSGTGSYTLIAAGGACKGSQPLTVKATGDRGRDEVRLDMELEHLGAMSWSCAGGQAVSLAEAVAPIEDEGRNLRVPIASRDPLRAVLERSTGGPAAGAVHWYVAIREQ